MKWLKFVRYLWIFSSYRQDSNQRRNCISKCFFWRLSLANSSCLLYRIFKPFTNPHENVLGLNSFWIILYLSRMDITLSRFLYFSSFLSLCHLEPESLFMNLDLPVDFYRWCWRFLWSFFRHRLSWASSECTISTLLVYLPSGRAVLSWRIWYNFIFPITSFSHFATYWIENLSSDK